MPLYEMSEVVPDITGVTFEFLIAIPVRPLPMASGELYHAGDLAIKQAARPAMWGVAMDVPLLLVDPDLPGESAALVMLPPGA